MHLETIHHLRQLATQHDDTVPVAKALLLDLLDSYERQAPKERRLLDGLVDSERELAQLRKACTPACSTPDADPDTLPDPQDQRRLRYQPHWSVREMDAIDELSRLKDLEPVAIVRQALRHYQLAHAELNNPALAVNKVNTVNPPPAPDALALVILRQLLTADDYDTIEAVKASAEDYLKSLNACPLDFAHQPHDHCDGTPSSSRQPVNQVNEVTPVPAPITFEAHGHTWTRHTPSDPCPVHPDTLVYVYDGIDDIGPYAADEFTWHAERHLKLGSNIIGWRHATPTTRPDAPRPEPSASDTPREPSSSHAQHTPAPAAV